MLVHSGGAPSSTTAIADYRAHNIDVREGYGLTKTASLTHFDTEATDETLSTVGAPMAGVSAIIAEDNGDQPLVELSSPALAVPLDTGEPLPDPTLRTTDLGRIDARDRLRLLGRADDHPVARLWPHDTLENPRPATQAPLCPRPPPGPQRITVHTLTPPALACGIIGRAADLLDLPREHVTVTSQDTAPLLHLAN
ncbi:AMP-binding protein [Actinomadura sp. NPDC048955]|uniref:AMP-binding protein n=1 Tax=Actinomadura sp. NPDC048955 TaxID=3158228 RepID=UPI00340CEBBD